jgi:DNA-binding transcriptional LysR family regulator
MELRHVRYFLAVAEERNFTRAASRLGIGQPPLSQQIHDLEDELGTALFYRVPRGAELTAAGAAFLVEARAVIAASERAKVAAKSAARGESGTLRIGFTSTSMFNPIGPQIIRSLRAKSPNVRIELREANSNSLVRQILDRELDAAFARPNNIVPDDLSVLTLGVEHFVVALPFGHPLSKEPSIDLGSLVGEPFVLSRSGMSFLQAIVDACEHCGFSPQVGQEASSASSTVNLVATGFGVALVPASIAQIRVRGVVYRKIKGRPPSILLTLVTRRGDRSAIVKSLLATAGSLKKS